MLLTQVILLVRITLRPKKRSILTNSTIRGDKRMQALVCELCGSNDIVKQGEFFVCQHCGTKYTVEEARKLLGTVKIDKSEETENLLVLARRARDENNSENAEKYYGMVLMQSPNDWEASFFHVYYQAAECKVAEISTAAQSVANCIDGNFALIKNLDDEKERIDALSMIINYSDNLVKQMATVASKHYWKDLSAIETQRRSIQWVVDAGNILFQIESSLKKHFYPDNKRELVTVQKKLYDYINDNAMYYNPSYRTNTTRRLVGEIKTLDHTFNKEPIPLPPPPSNKKGGCYVATAVYGSYDCPQVWTLRRFRDDTLAETWYGRAFIHTYYAVSPTLVRWFGKADWFRNLWKPTLDKMVDRLNRQGVADTPYFDKRW